MIAVRYAALAAVALWLGSTSALGLFVAPAIDRAARAADPAVAAAVESVRNEIFRLFHFFSYACGAVVFVSLMVMKFVGPPPASFKARVALVSLMLAIAAYSGLWLDREIREQRATISGPPALAESDPRRARLERLQQTDGGLMGANVVLGAVLLFWYVRE